MSIPASQRPKHSEAGKFTIIQVREEKPSIPQRLTEYCADLFNYETDGDPTVPYTQSNHWIWGNQLSFENIPAELVIEGETLIEVLTSAYI